jgi:hypothetical protein
VLINTGILFSMHVQVVALSEVDPSMVRIATSAGEIETGWVGELPSLGQIDDVELGVDDGLVLDETIFDLSRDVPLPDDPSMVRGVEAATARALLPGTSVGLPIRNARAYSTGT